jgi:hypothetical protein
VRDVGELGPRKLRRSCAEGAISPETFEGVIEAYGEVSVAWALVSDADSMCGSAMKAASADLSCVRPVDQASSGWYSDQRFRW